MRRLALATLSLLTFAACGRSGPSASTTTTKKSPLSPAVVTDVPTPADNPKELGWVHWSRNFDEARQIARKTGKPIFVLFQEVPGCATCVGFGQSVLAHPLIIEAIETAFVPVAIYNNEGGHDADVLKRFGEPSWNNPVVRFVDADGKDLIPRAESVWSDHGIASRMKAALEAHGGTPPDYLQWAVSETTPRPNRATFAMGCYWSGEACLGDVYGVIGTRAGWLDGREVVEVEFDENVTNEGALRHEADRRGCGQLVAKAGSPRSAGEGDQKYHLKRSLWRYVPLTSRQASRVNAALARGGDPTVHASPRQRALYRRIVARGGDALSGLKRPEQSQLLPAYQHDLLARLGD